MRLVSLAASSVLAAMLISSCASTRILPKDDGTYLVVGNSESESRAFDAALDDAKDLCQKRGRRFRMIHQKAEYKGMDKTAKGVVNALGMVTGNGSDSYYATHSHDDNRVEIHFRCI